MTPEQTDLARRAVACAAWRWEDGMLDTWGQRGQGARGVWEGLPDVPLAARPECLPDITDPATLGCLLGMVREAYKDPWWVPYNVYDPNSGRLLWAGHGYGGGTVTAHFIGVVGVTSEAEVLVRALEGAP